MFRAWYSSSTLPLFSFTGLLMCSIIVHLDSYDLDIFTVNYEGVEEFHEGSTGTRYAASENRWRQLSWSNIYICIYIFFNKYTHTRTHTHTPLIFSVKAAGEVLLGLINYLCLIYFILKFSMRGARSVCLILSIYYFLLGSRLIKCLSSMLVLVLDCSGVLSSHFWIRRQLRRFM